MINHATVLIQLDGVNILTDPIYSYSISFFIPRLKTPGIPFRELPKIDLILISHSDYDHLNLRTLRRLSHREETNVIVPNGLASYARRTGFKNITELNLWDTADLGNIHITCTPAKHSGRRGIFNKRISLACGYVIHSTNQSIYFAGDTGYDSFFTELANKFSLDVALLPIGAYKPYEWFKNRHLHPRTAMQAFQDLRAKHLIPMHWGTFKISDEPMSQPPVLLAQEAERLGLADRVHILRNGDSFSL